MHRMIINRTMVVSMLVRRLTRSSSSAEFRGRMVEGSVRSPFPDPIIPENKNLAAYILDDFQHNYDQVALVDGISGREVTYAQLAETTSRLSSGLRRMGLQKGDVVAVCSPNSIEYANVYLGTIAAGGIVSTCNPAFSARELAYQFRNSNAKYIVTTPAELKKVHEAIADIPHVEKILVTEEGHSSSPNLVSLHQLFQDSGSAYRMEPIGNSRDDIAVLPYSSGTTGLPKGVMLTHHNVVSNCCQLDHPNALGLRNGETMMSIVPFFHIYGMVLILFLGLRKGAKQIVFPNFEPGYFLRSIEKYRIESAGLVPPLILFLSKHEDVDKFDLSSLRSILSGGAPLGKELIHSTCERTGIEVIRQAYGLTETSPVTHIMPLSMAMNKTGSIGLPLPNMACKVVDINNHDVSLGPNEEGELIIDGPNVMKGYLNKPEETAKCIDSKGCFHTGDVGYYDEDGYFYITDRLKELIKVKGFQVAPAELEALLLDHPEISDAAVVGVANERLGEAPKAFVVRSSSTLRQQDVEKYVQENISKHKWLAGGVEFVDQIPKSPSGKILRRQLRQ